MALPLLPFAAKGLMVVAKYIMSKGAVGKAAITMKQVVSTYGVATAATATTTGVVIIGGIVWTQESINSANNAYKYYQKGDKVKAAKELSLLAVNIKSMGSTDFAGSLQDWIDTGKQIDTKEFVMLINEARKIAMEAVKTAKKK